MGLNRNIMTQKDKQRLIPLLSDKLKVTVINIYKNGRILKVSNNNNIEYWCGWLREYPNKLYWIHNSVEDNEGKDMPFVFGSLKDARRNS